MILYMSTGVLARDYPTNPTSVAPIKECVWKWSYLRLRPTQILNYYKFNVRRSLDCRCEENLLDALTERTSCQPPTPHRVQANCVSCGRCSVAVRLLLFLVVRVLALFAGSLRESGSA